MYSSSCLHASRLYAKKLKIQNQTLRKFVFFIRLFVSRLYAKVGYMKKKKKKKKRLEILREICLSAKKMFQFLL